MEMTPCGATGRCRWRMGTRRRRKPPLRKEPTKRAVNSVLYSPILLDLLAKWRWTFHTVPLLRRLKSLPHLQGDVLPATAEIKIGDGDAERCVFGLYLYVLGPLILLLLLLLLLRASRRRVLVAVQGLYRWEMLVEVCASPRWWRTACHIAAGPMGSRRSTRAATDWGSPPQCRVPLLANRSCVQHIAKATLTPEPIEPPSRSDGERGSSMCSVQYTVQYRATLTASTLRVNSSLAGVSLSWLAAFGFSVGLVRMYVNASQVVSTFDEPLAAADQRGASGLTRHTPASGTLANGPGRELEARKTQGRAAGEASCGPHHIEGL